MSDKFTFSLDSRCAALVRITMHGFCGLEDVAAFFEAAAQGARRRSACRASRISTLNDLRGMKIQAQEVDPGLPAGSGRARRKRRRELAIVVDAAHGARRRPTGRSRRPHTRYFTDPEDAEAWLFAGVAGAARRAGRRASQWLRPEPSRIAQRRLSKLVGGPDLRSRYGRKILVQRPSGHGTGQDPDGRPLHARGHRRFSRGTAAGACRAGLRAQPASHAQRSRAA